MVHRRCAVHDPSHNVDYRPACCLGQRLYQLKVLHDVTIRHPLLVLDVQMVVLVIFHLGCLLHLRARHHGFVFAAFSHEVGVARPLACATSSAAPIAYARHIRQYAAQVGGVVYTGRKPDNSLDAAYIQATTLALECLCR